MMSADSEGEKIDECRCPVLHHADAVLLPGLLPQSRVSIGFKSISYCHSTVPFQFGQSLYPFSHLFPDGQS